MLKKLFAKSPRLAKYAIIASGISIGIDVALLGGAVLDYHYPDKGKNYLAIRLFRSAYTMSWIGAEYLYYRNKDLDKFHERTAQKIKKLAEMNQGIYLPICKQISQSASLYVLPSVYKDVLSQIDFDTPLMSEQTLKENLCKVLKVDSLDKMFTEFNFTPMDKDSYAEYHAATTTDGDKVRVKCLNDMIDRFGFADVAVMHYLIENIQKQYPTLDMVWFLLMLDNEIKRKMEYSISRIQQ